MAIKQRKQITGTTAQIKSFAGHEGVLAFDKQTKHLHVLSGTAGKTTELANKSDIPAPQDISGKADKTYVDTQLATKEAKGTAYSKVESDGKYATKTEVTQGLAGKAPTAHTHTKSQITDFPSIPDTSTLIPKTGARGEIAGYEAVKVLSGATTINGASPDNLLAQAGTPITVQTGASQESWTKVIRFVASPQLTLGGSWNWVGGSAPTIEPSHVVVLHWDGIGGYASLLKGK